MNQMLPFIDTREFRALRAACNLVTYPHEFCLREANRRLVGSLTEESQGARALVHILSRAQEELAPHLPLNGMDVIWSGREVYLQQMGITTTGAAGMSASILSTADYQLNQTLLEAVLATVPNNPDGNASSATALPLASKCHWLSELLALVVLRVAEVQQQADGTCMVGPVSDVMRQHLRRLWFGSAFEQLSLMAASAAIRNLAIIAADPSRRSQLGPARFSALTIFPQHWRLPVESGPVSELLFDSLEPLLAMLIHVIAASTDRRLPPFGQKHAVAKGIEDAYQAVREIQQGLPTVDRLFTIVDDGLLLGTCDLASGAIATAERLAERKLGPDWHGNFTSAAQKEYLLQRIGENAHIEVLDFELRQHHTTSDIDLDVDFFIRDKAHGLVYGVQLKHLKKGTRAGLLAWLALFRERDEGLGNLVRQLEKLTDFAPNDQKCRSLLLEKGLSPSECDRIVPVGIHNVGFVDFWTVQNGVALYDMHTFANILAGRVAVAVGMIKGQVIHGAINAHAGQVPSAHQPDSVIDAYLADPRFPTLSGFDLAAKISRKSSLGSENVVANGLGL
jgi:hypothetical protein